MLPWRVSRIRAYAEMDLYRDDHLLRLHARLPNLGAGIAIRFYNLPFTLSHLLEIAKRLDDMYHEVQTAQLQQQQQKQGAAQSSSAQLSATVREVGTV